MDTIKTIVVTGCAGYIGSRFVEIFHNRFPHVRIIGIDDLSTGTREKVLSCVKLYTFSITETALVQKIFIEEKPELVFHFAAMPRVQYCQEHPTETYETNVLGSSIIFEAAAIAGVRRVIFSSSAAVYGNAISFPVCEDTSLPQPISFYGLQKYAVEQIATLMCAHRNIDIACLRYFNVYGPGQNGSSSYATVIARWLDALQSGKEIAIDGDGTQTRDFVYVDDVVEANIQAACAEKPLRGAACNIATGTEISLLDIKNKIEELSGKKLPVAYRPPRSGDIAHIKADIERARDMLHWEPKVTFEEGIYRTVASYLD
jgi:UDP-glucose 4-epimerase